MKADGEGYLIKLLERFKTRSLVVVILSLGAVTLAAHDPSFRPAFSNLVSLALGGYYGQMFPESKDRQ